MLRIAPPAMARALDFFVGAEKRFGEDGCLDIILTNQHRSSLRWLIPIMLSFGVGAEVVSPPEIRKAVKEQLQNMLEKYREV
ncbi:WYL domain-containing protein [Paenibacillus sp. JTLBN-2024]